MNVPTKERFQELIAYLNHGLVERDSTLKAALLTVLAGENLLLIGPPGTAKSLIARKVADCLEHDGTTDQMEGYFEYLLTKFSTPEEIFGPLSISELKADRFKRNTAGYLPSVRIAFLDEIFKASSSILNALLTILNERLYHNGATAQQVPLQALVAASNELPTGQEELEALYDRFLVRSFVDYVSEDNLPRLLDKPGPPPTNTPLSATDLAAIRQAAEAMVLPTDIVSAIQKIWAGHKQMFKEDRRENLSDRRLKKAVGLLCISAATNGRREVDLSDLLLLKDCLWNHPDNALKVRELVMSTLRTFSRSVPLSQSEQRAPHEHATPAYVTCAPHSAAKMGAVVKGYKGSGTEHDPILIETLLDLAGLERPEVGQKGYWFRQTADIDCKELTTWLKINFQGHYDGGGHTVDRGTQAGRQRLFEYQNTWAPLFEEVGSESYLSNLSLKGLGLARTISDTTITACSSDCQLLDRAINNSRISYCQSDSSLITNIEQSAISCCQAEEVLIFSTAKNCTIQDCWARARLYLTCSDGCYNGGVTGRLTENSVVERCLVAGGKISGSSTRDYINFFGIAYKSESSTIRQCALGALEKQGDGRLRKRIAGEISGTKLENNVALDCHPGNSDPNGPDGKSLSAALFTQHYFEHSLGWDFENIWQWNDEHKQPALRAVGVGAIPYEGMNAASVDTGDLLTQQLTANLWL